MAKTGFIKIKDKGFKKEFSKENINKIWDFFKVHFSDIKGLDIDWSKEHYLSHILGNVKIPLYPETDIWDNSEGITPKQLKIIISYMGFENFKLFSKILSYKVSFYSIGDEKIYNQKDNIFSWKEAIKKNILPKIKNNENLEIGRSLFYMKFFNISSFQSLNNNAVKFPYSINNSIFKKIVRDHNILNQLEYLKNNNIYDLNTELSLDLLDTDEFFEKRSNKWMEICGFIPKSKDLLILNPKFWDKDSFLSGMNILFKTKQLRNLSDEDQKKYIYLYKSFGKTIVYVAPMLLNENLNEVDPTWPELYMEETPLSLLKILENSSRGIDIKLKVSQFIFMFKTLNFFNDAESVILKKDRITIDDIKSLVEVGELFNSFSAKEIENLKNISWEHISIFKKYNINSSLIEKYISLYSKVSNIKLKHIPVVKGTVNEYTYEILPKSDIRGLICGHATNCCQHLDNEGRSCTMYGAEAEDSTFFIISKNGAIIAESWLWLDESKKIMVCDSVESLVRSLKIQECYNKMAEDVFEKSEIEEVRVGASSVFPEKLNIVDSVELPSCPKEYNKDKLYSDAGTQYILARKK